MIQVLSFSHDIWWSLNVIKNTHHVSQNLTLQPRKTFQSQVEPARSAGSAKLRPPVRAGTRSGTRPVNEESAGGTDERHQIEPRFWVETAQCAQPTKHVAQ